MKHQTARKINELFQTLYNVKPDENAFIDTDIIDVENNVVLTAEQYNQLIEPTNDEIYNFACAVLRSYHVELDQTHTLELFFLKLLAQQNIYVVHLDTDNEQIIRLHQSAVHDNSFLSALRDCTLYRTSIDFMQLLSVLARTLKNIIDDESENCIDLFADYALTVHKFAATSNLDNLIADIDANY